MRGFVSSVRLFVLAGLLAFSACGGKSTSDGNGGAGGGTAGSGASGAPITSCPASMPTVMTNACSGSPVCQFNSSCTCHGCCFAVWGCENGVFKQVDFNDGCIQGPTCPDGGAGTSGAGTGGGGGGKGGRGGSGGVGGGSAVCTFGADQTCNDNPAVSSIHGQCTDAGMCACGDAGTNPDSGRCL